jgi:transcriptional regulator with XRE-family HTH domain
VARRRLRLSLRSAREACGLTQGQVAEAMEWSLSKVTRIEGGDVGITPNDVRALLPCLGVTDADEVRRFVDDARVARSRRQWWSMPEFRRLLTPAMRKLIQFEAGAVEIRYFGIMLVPGIMQTREYAEAILRSYRPGLDDDLIAARAESRIRRKQELLSAPGAPDIYLLLDESVLYREVGSATIMGRQLLEVLRLAERSNIWVRVIPFAAAAPIALLGPFELVDLPGRDAIIYRESVLFDRLSDDRGLCDVHRGHFENLWDCALGDADSLSLVRERAESMLSSSPTSAAGRGGAWRRRKAPRQDVVGR